VYLAHPDSMVMFDPSGASGGKEVYTYTAERWLHEVKTVDVDGSVPFTASAGYTWNKDTLCTNFTYTPPSNISYTKSVFDAHGFPIRDWCYDSSGLVEIDSYVYSASGKLAKQLIQNPNPNAYGGDSVIFSYDASDHLVSSTQYGYGAVWSFQGFVCDGSGRLIRFVQYDCDTQCAPSGYYGIFYYSHDAVRRNPVSASGAAIKPVSCHFTSGDQIIVTSNRTFIVIAAIKVFNISGAVVCSFQARNGHRENLPVLSRSNQVYLCAVETNKGRFTFKINR
jgi:hypothetical protein